ncbi:MAG: hypothetical protein ACI8U4_001271 [Natronomonas sp.]
MVEWKGEERWRRSGVAEKALSDRSEDILLSDRHLSGGFRGGRGTVTGGGICMKTNDQQDAHTSVRPETDAFFLDVMLGKLAVYLRLAGYDTAYAGDRGIEADDRILELAEAEDRILLTRDVQLAEQADESILLSAKAVEDQLAELREAGVALEADEEPSRCGRCNGRLDAVPENADTPDYAPDPAETDCWRCRDCGQVFWKGSHYERMKETLG